MSTPRPVSPRQATIFPEIPKGDVISTYDSYHDAQLAVDALARANFPVANLAILGNDIRSVERVTGKLTYGRVALMGALSGAYLGLFFGLILYIFQPDNSGILGVFLAAVAIGAGFGMLFGVLSYAMNRNRRDFSSVMQLVATRYDVITEPQFVQDARQILIGDQPQGE
ncbi:general stress protein [Leucobacter sp. M11]|uniref:general stress protein n=1 Tax=Leucobacter sp. M11 TaxID=2993565 RepID=UPI002D8112E4|nr:general stress protein [Leucobacter sp. M11]MEB4615963.1 hypothetical protein [Leucobacter sp. M11]